MSKAHFTTKDDGTQNCPGTDSPWEHWVSASKTRNFLIDDPLLDWLNLYGADHGLHKDTDAPGYDERCDHLQFILNKGLEFESQVLEALNERFPVTTIANHPRDSRSKESVAATWNAIAAGSPIIAQAVLWNPENQTFGMPDLLVRSDVLEQLFPSSLTIDDAKVPAPELSVASGWHYRVVDIKFSTLDLLRDGSAGAKHKAYMAQTWLYNEALGRIQGYLPTASYILGRGWKQGQERGDSALDRLARVDHDRDISKQPLAVTVHEACSWYLKVRNDGNTWSPLPTPTIPKLRPNLRHTSDAPWHSAKKHIATELDDLTIIPRINPQKRDTAYARGITRWTDPACHAAALGLTQDSAQKADSILDANRSPADGPVVFPSRITASEEDWRRPAPVEFYVDFETVSDLDDDFNNFPHKGGPPLIFMIGLGWLATPGDLSSWKFEVFTTDRLAEPDEATIIQNWLTRMQQLAAAKRSSLEDARLYHWSPAETSTLTNAYNSAAARQPEADWPDLPWVDLLAKIIRPQPVTLRGAWGFGLKAVTKAMHAAGLIDTDWPDGPADGLGAMTGAWWCEKEAARTSTSMTALPLMQAIEAYNEIDCKAMADILNWLRANR